MNIDVYNRIKKNSLPLLEDYKTDLLQHDFKQITSIEWTSFIHFTRNSGTHLLKLSTVGYPKKNEIVPYLFSQADRLHILKELYTVFETLQGSALIIQYYDFNNDTVKIISSESAESLILNFTRNTIKKWSVEK